MLPGTKAGELVDIWLKLLPWKLTCPLKIDGWKMYSLLKWSLFRGHVSFHGCIRNVLSYYNSFDQGLRFVICFVCFGTVCFVEDGFFVREMTVERYQFHGFKRSFSKFKVGEIANLLPKLNHDSWSLIKMGMKPCPVRCSRLFSFQITSRLKNDWQEILWRQFSSNIHWKSALFSTGWWGSAHLDAFLLKDMVMNAEYWLNWEVSSWTWRKYLQLVLLACLLRERFLG